MKATDSPSTSLCRPVCVRTSASTSRSQGFGAILAAAAGTALDIGSQVLRQARASTVSQLIGEMFKTPDAAD